jgi:hypothetical protein
VTDTGTITLGQALRVIAERTGFRNDEERAQVLAAIDTHNDGVAAEEAEYDAAATALTARVLDGGDDGDQPPL